jgi:flagellar hook-length control protein FliK
MIQRLHLEEAQQPSAYAISAARESGEYRDDKEKESLALEFQSLLAQISGQIAAIPDQAMAVGLALAQTAAPEQQRRDIEANFEDESGQSQDLLSQHDDQARNFGVDDSARRYEMRGDKQDDEGEAVEDNQENLRGEGDRLVADDGSEVVSAEEQIVEAVEQTLVQQVGQVGNDNTGKAEDVEVVIQGPRENTAEQSHVVAEDAVSEDANLDVETQTKEQVHADLKQARVEVKQVKKEESVEEDELAQSLASVVESSERDNEIALKTKKNSHLDAKHRDTSEESHAIQKSDQYSSGSDSLGRNQSQKHNLDQKPGQQDMEFGSRMQKLSDGGGKSLKNAKESQTGEFVETLAAPVNRSADRTSDGSSFQMTILRQSFDALKMSRVDDRASRPQSSSVTQAGASTETKSTQSEQASRSSKTLTRPQTAKMLERVEATLKEAARSRDGRTISLHLEPVNLGKVKVDVSLREGVLHARIAPENQQVMTALREHAHELQSSLRKLGLDVESVSVSVTSDSFEGEMNTGQQMSDGRSFQDERNKMPREKAQLAETTVGNELAQHTSAGAETRGSATRNELDHWVA